jgi:hypothetical protein
VTPEQVLARVARGIGAVALVTVVGLVGAWVTFIGLLTANGFYDDLPGRHERWWGDLFFVGMLVATLALASFFFSRAAGLRLRWGPVGALASWASIVGLFWLSA